MLNPERFSADLVDGIQDSLVAVAEIGANRLLSYDEVALAGCVELQGSCIAIDITDLDFQLYCHPGSWGIRLGRRAPAREVDATISGRLMALLNLAALDDKLSTSMREQVSFQGRVALAQKLQKILGELDIDWEEMLAERSGDVLAYQVHSRARGLANWLRQSADSVLQTSSEYLREEAQMCPGEVEFEMFQTQVTELRHDVARVELRLQRLLEKMRSG